MESAKRLPPPPRSLPRHTCWAGPDDGHDGTVARRGLERVRWDGPVGEEERGGMVGGERRGAAGRLCCVECSVLCDGTGESNIRGRQGPASLDPDRLFLPVCQGGAAVAWRRRRRRKRRQ